MDVGRVTVIFVRAWVLRRFLMEACRAGDEFLAHRISMNGEEHLPRAAHLLHHELPRDLLLDPWVPRCLQALPILGVDHWTGDKGFRGHAMGPDAQAIRLRRIVFDEDDEGRML